MIVIKALVWLGVGIIGFFLLMLIVYIAARIRMNAYIDEINKVYENSFLNQSKTESNDEKEKK